jgi:hypothetical protein
LLRIFDGTAVGGAVDTVPFAPCTGVHVTPPGIALAPEPAHCEDASGTALTIIALVWLAWVALWLIEQHW